MRQLLPAVQQPKPASMSLKDLPRTTLSSEMTKRAASRACDRCRKRKICCDGLERKRQNRVCSRCDAASAMCTYSETVQRSRPTNNYVKQLEQRIATAEKLLRLHCPEVNLMQELGTSTTGALLRERNREYEMLNDSLSSDEDDYSQFHRLSSDQTPVERPTLPELLRATVQNPECASDIISDLVKRPHRWRIPEYEFHEQHLVAESSFHPCLPDHDQVTKLVTSYFDNFNIYYPILHRPLFEKQLSDPQDSRDQYFVALLLVVCALGDTFLLRRDTRTTKLTMPAGWQYFEQIEPFLRVHTPRIPRLLDIQIYILSAIYLTSTTQPASASWVLLGMTLRSLMLVEAHRARAYKNYPNLIDELWKRAFWTAVMMDRLMCSSWGRPSAAPEEAFDVWMPLEVDDGSWDMLNATSGYPLKTSVSLGLPSRMGYFVHKLRLSLILGTASRTIYSPNRSRVLMGFIGADWEQNVIKKLEASLNEWLQMLPQHLHWDPYQKDPRWFNESAFLHTTYCAVQIVVHNPFTRSVVRLSPQVGEDNAVASAPGANFISSLRKCTKAAFSCTRVLAAVVRRGSQHAIMPSQTQGAYASGLILLLNMFGARGSLPCDSADAAKMMAAVRTCLDTISLIERSWKSAGRSWDILNDLAGGLDHPLPPSSLKYAEDRDYSTKISPSSTQSSTSSLEVESLVEARGATLREAASLLFWDDIQGVPFDASTPADSWGFGLNHVPPFLQVLLSSDIQMPAVQESLGGWS
ncbi:fungal-specific transcription factor domain-containing protein [Auriculariales sp. MPI-PUGE-AT-0066]|nr:fungal-specific transcription factor domain-containing protein [Auriculariales sp. MPI-PUGE-AT-0066]